MFPECYLVAKGTGDKSAPALEFTARGDGSTDQSPDRHLQLIEPSTSEVESDGGR